MNGKIVDDVNEFQYLEAIVDKYSGGYRDMLNRLEEAKVAFQSLWKVCSARGTGKKTKVILFNTQVRPALFYGCEIWKFDKTDERRLDTFQH